MNIVIPTSAKCWYKLSRYTRLQDKAAAMGNTAGRIILRVNMSGAWEGKTPKLNTHEVWEWWC